MSLDQTKSCAGDFQKGKNQLTLRGSPENRLAHRNLILT